MNDENSNAKLMSVNPPMSSTDEQAVTSGLAEQAVPVTVGLLKLKLTCRREWNEETDRALMARLERASTASGQASDDVPVVARRAGRVVQTPGPYGSPSDSGEGYQLSYGDGWSLTVGEEWQPEAHNLALDVTVGGAQLAALTLPAIKAQVDALIGAYAGSECGTEVSGLVAYVDLHGMDAKATFFDAFKDGWFYLNRMEGYLRNGCLSLCGRGFELHITDQGGTSQARTRVTIDIGLQYLQWSDRLLSLADNLVGLASSLREITTSWCRWETSGSGAAELAPPWSKLVAALTTWSRQLTHSAGQHMVFHGHVTGVSNKQQAKKG